MIVNYSFENFQSYRDTSDVDFSVTSKTPLSYYDYETTSKTKIAKVMAVLGPNGSGKSNLLKPISFVAWFAAMSFGDMKKGDRIPVIPHKLRSEDSTKVKIDFILPRWNNEDSKKDSELEFRYVVEIVGSRVLEETLKIKTSRQYSRVFERKYNTFEKAYEVKLSKVYGPDISNKTLENAPENCSLISYIDGLRQSDQSPVCEDSNIAVVALAHRYFYKTFSNLTFNGRSHLIYAMDEALGFYADFPEQFEFTKNLFKQYDLGIDDIYLEESIVVNRHDGSKSTETLAFCVHNTSDGNFSIPMFMESSGTQSAFCTMAMVCEALEFGGLIVLDEFDNDFHPELTMAIVNLFKDANTNPKNAQLLFNTHTVEVLKHLKRQHCYFVEKDNGNSDAYRGDQIEGLKDRDNLYKKYMSGALGAFPDIE